MEKVKQTTDTSYLKHEVGTLTKLIKKKDSEIKSYKAALDEIRKQISDSEDKVNKTDNS